MMKIITFHGRVNNYTYDEMAGDCADDKFNRWMADHKDVVIKDIKIEMTQEVYQVITVVYDEPIGFVEYHSTFEDGHYYLDLDCGKLINCKTGVDVSYMVKNFEAIRSAFGTHMSSKSVISVYCGKLHFRYTFTAVSDKYRKYGPKDGSSGLETQVNNLSISAGFVIHDRYLASHTVLSQSGDFKIHEHPGKYRLIQLGISNWQLIYDKSNLDISHILNKYSNTLAGYLSSDSPIECDGTKFTIDMRGSNPREILCSEIIHERYL